jgi:hypothetical protein
LVDRLVLIQVLGIVALLALAGNLTFSLRRRPATGSGSPPFDGFGWSARGGHDVDGFAQEGQTLSESSWTRRLAVEQARLDRHGRSASIVAMHLGGPTGAIGRRSATRLGPHVRLTERISTSLRATDVVRAGSDGIIRVLLSETDEAGARAYAQRLAQSLPAWGDEVGADASLTAAWAATAAGRDLRSAHRLAHARLRGAADGWLRSASAQTAPDRARAEPRQPGRPNRLPVSDQPDDSRTSPSRKA